MGKLENKNVYAVDVMIENKPFLNDPEGETILKDLILKEKYEDVIEVRSAKVLKIRIMAQNEKDAKFKIKKMCDDLRIYNPIVSKCEIIVHNINH